MISYEGIKKPIIALFIVLLVSTIFSSSLLVTIILQGFTGINYSSDSTSTCQQTYFTMKFETYIDKMYYSCFINSIIGLISILTVLFLGLKWLIKMYGKSKNKSLIKKAEFFATYICLSLFLMSQTVIFGYFISFIIERSAYCNSNNVENSWYVIASEGGISIISGTFSWILNTYLMLKLKNGDQIIQNQVDRMNENIFAQNQNDFFSQIKNQSKKMQGQPLLKNFQSILQDKSKNLIEQDKKKMELKDQLFSKYQNKARKTLQSIEIKKSKFRQINPRKIQHQKVHIQEKQVENQVSKEENIKSMQKVQNLDCYVKQFNENLVQSAVRPIRKPKTQIIETETKKQVLKPSDVFATFFFDNQLQQKQSNNSSESQKKSIKEEDNDNNDDKDDDSEEENEKQIDLKKGKYKLVFEKKKKPKANSSRRKKLNLFEQQVGYFDYNNSALNPANDSIIPDQTESIKEGVKQEIKKKMKNEMKMKQKKPKNQEQSIITFIKRKYKKQTDQVE